MSEPAHSHGERERAGTTALLGKAVTVSAIDACTKLKFSGCGEIRGVKGS